MAEYIEREAAIKRFNFAVLDCLGMEPTIRAGDIIKALESIPAADVRPVEWIPVTERLPEDLTRVIVFCEDGVSYGLCEHLIENDEEVVEWHDFLHYPITPTHWMPLPEPPKEGDA